MRAPHASALMPRSFHGVSPAAPARPSVSSSNQGRWGPGLGGIMSTKKRRAALAGVVAATLAVGIAVVASTGTASAHGRWAEARLRSADGTRLGSVSFADDRDSGGTAVTAWLRRTTAVDAFHGLHIH